MKDDPNTLALQVDKIKPNSIVRVRSRKWLVTKIQRSQHQDTLVSLACLEDDAQGETLDVFWERELDARSDERQAAYANLERGFDDPRTFGSWLHTLYWNRVTAADPGRFQAPDRAGIEVKAYQLEPLRKALRLPRVNLFIADDVGLGKTIEAGLIARELILRQRARRIVIMAPPSVVVQWWEEMEERFGLTFQIFDREYVLRNRRERGYAANPWQTHTRFIISHALLRNETYASLLRQWLGDFCDNSLLILDEAHNAAPASGTKYAVDSQFTTIVRGLAHRFEHKLFLSATPHNGHSNSFTALLELLDPQRFCRGIDYDDLRTRLKPIMVRRLKKDLRQLTSGFPERILEPLIIKDLPEHSPELTLSRMLQAYRASREAAFQDSKGAKKATALLVINNLQKRLLSSFPAFAHTLGVHMASLRKDKNPEHARRTHTVSATQMSLLDGLDADDERGTLSDEDILNQEEEAVAQASQAHTLGAQEWQLLEEMHALAKAQQYKPDARVKKLISWVREHQCPDLGKKKAQWLPRRLIIFTEYTTTKTYLRDCLQEAISRSDLADQRIETFEGGLSDERREELKAAFNTHPDAHPLRILIATDAAREGVNLQNHCYDLLHFDVPWNPARMEQRNGRIDRKLQRNDQVFCRYFILPQRAEDKVLDTLVRKTNTILGELGSMSPVIHRNMEKLMKTGIDHSRAEDMQADLLKADKDSRNGVIREQLEFTRETLELQKQIETCSALLGESRRWMRLDSQHFREALSTSLMQLGADPLKPLTDEEGQTVWEFPQLEQLLKAGPGWANTLDTLRSPRPRDAKLWEWRKTAPIRPVIFQDPGDLDRKRVHLHLEHRAVQRLLGAFKTHGFHNQLSRACIVQTEKITQPHVVLLGRISLYNHSAGRLYDDLVRVTAIWSAADAPKILDEDASEGVWEAVLEALGHPSAIDGQQENLIRRTAQRDVDMLDGVLRERVVQLEKDVKKRLRSRADNEARQMRRLLARQKDLLLQKINPDTTDQPVLPGIKEEQEQVKREQKHWEARLGQIDEEMETEPARVRTGYAVKASRFAPTAIVWLWPRSL